MLWEQGVGGSNPLAPTIKIMGYGLGRSPFFVWGGKWRVNWTIRQSMKNSLARKQKVFEETI